MILLNYVYNALSIVYKERRRCEDNHGENNHRDATTFNWTTFNCWFETSSDKLQNVSQSVNVSSLETVCL